MGYYKVRDYSSGKFEKRYRKVLKFFWKLFISVWLTGYSVVAVWLLFVQIGHQSMISTVEAQERYSGANFGSSEALKVLVGTKMEDSIPYIAEAAKYYDLPVTLYIGIANAESSLNRFKDGCYNPWGIGNNNTPRCYESWKQGVDEFSRLIKYYYFAEGKITPEQMRDKYVGKGIGSPQWSDNVRKYYNPQIIIKFE